MSFAFRIVRVQWSPDYDEYRMLEYDIHRGDVAIVGYAPTPPQSYARSRQACSRSAKTRRVRCCTSRHGPAFPDEKRDVRITNGGGQQPACF